MTFSLTDTAAVLTFDNPTDVTDFLQGITTEYVLNHLSCTITLPLPAPVMNNIREQITTSALMVINGHEKTMPCSGDYATAVKYLLIDHIQRERARAGLNA
jgi:hypothetical protein